MQASNVLITGANGFLGRFLALEALERVAPLGGRVYCLVRAQSDEEARKRMIKSYETPDGKLQAHVAGLEGHLTILAGGSPLLPPSPSPCLLA